MATPTTINDSMWYVDSQANQITSNLNNFSLHNEYNREENVLIGNSRFAYLSY